MAVRWLLLVVAISAVTADFDCVCNYNVELEVRNGMSDSAAVVGSLYEFDCKESVKTVSVDPGWTAIAFHHNVGYVRTNNNTQSQSCPGSAPESDKLSDPSSTTTTEAAVETTTTAATPAATITTTLATETTASTTVVTTPSTTVTTVPSTTVTVQTMTPKPTTMAPVTTVTTTPTASTTSPATAVPVSTTAQSGIVSGQTNLCPVALRSFTADDHGKLAQYDKSCYELVPRAHTWSYAEKDCKSKGGHLIQINTQGEQDFIYQLIKTNNNHNTWIGLHDLNKEGQYEWASGESPVYTNWVSGTPPQHPSEDCIFMNVVNGGGKWDDHTCSTTSIFGTGSSAPYICQYDIDESTMVNGTVNPHGDGNTHLCPTSVVTHATRYHTILGQYAQNCYELLPPPRYDLTWSHAETMCKQRGGHLASISNAEEQSFLHDFLENHMPNHGAWIGLNDRSSEGKYEWSSGAPVTYTNWIKGHSGSIYENPGREDCALFLPYAGGHWDDLTCGSTSIFFGDRGETHPAICQYHTSGGSPAVG